MSELEQQLDSVATSQLARPIGGAARGLVGAQRFVKGELPERL
jgi:hypothetical protein